MAWWSWRQRLAEWKRRAATQRKKRDTYFGRLRMESLESRRVLVASTISVADVSKLEGDVGSSNMTFILTRSGDLNSVVTLACQTSDGTATAGSDYTAQAGTITFGLGQATASVNVPILGDTVGENNESFQFSLTGIVNASGPDVSLAGQQTFAANTQTISVFLADLNGDGLPEAIASNLSGGSVSIFLNTTSPGATAASFATKQDLTTSNPLAIAVGDVNGDGRPDLAVTNYTSNSVSVFLNTTTTGATSFSFASGSTFSTGTRPHAVVFSDVNNDGRADLAVAAFSASQMCVLLNTTAAGATTASFATQQTFSTPANPIAIASKDVNGDGKNDLVTVNRGADNVSVFLNNTTINGSTVSLANRQDFSTGAFPRALTLADVNNDGRIDIATANFNANTVSVLLNQTLTGAATPSFATKQDFATAAGPRSVTAADANGDGKVELIVADRDGNAVSTFVNRTAPGATTVSFDSHHDFTAGTQPYSVAAGDINGDGASDIVTANLGSGNISVLVNNTTILNSTPSLSAASVALASAANGVTAADFNGDGRADLAASTGGNKIGVLLNNATAGAATASFGTRLDVTVSAAPASVTAADLNLDGRPDLIVPTANNNVAIFVNNATAGASAPSFANEQSFATGASPFEVTVGDINGDGLLDLLVSASGTNSVNVLLNTTTPGSTTVSFATAVTVSMTNQPRGVLLADLNGDGKPDLVAANQGTGYSSGSGSTVSVRLNTTTAGAMTPTFASKQDFAVGSAPRSVAVLDINGDGKLDLATANRQGNNVSILMNTTSAGATSAAFASQQTMAAGTEPYTIRAADFNGDGRSDLVVGNRSSATTIVLINTTTPGSATAAFTAATYASGNSPSVAVADLNGDGRADFAIADAGTANLRAVVTNLTAFGTAQATGTITNDDAPTVVAIARNNPTGQATNSSSVTFAVTFSHDVTGVDATDFQVGGAVNAGTPSVSGNGSSYSVTFSSITGEGLLQLSLVDDDSIVDVGGHPLGGSGANNGNFIGQSYTIDHTAPDLSANNSPQANANLWNNTNVTVTFSSTSSDVATISSPVTVTTEGINQSAHGSATDNAGNTSSLTQTGINIDKTKPTIGHSLDSTANSRGWFNHDVGVTFNGSDALSGIDSIVGDTTVTAEGANLQVTGTATDKAGNQQTDVVTLKIDKTSPHAASVTSTSASGTYGPGATINITVLFSENVYLTNGTLQVTLNNGAVFDISSINGQSSVSYSYVVAASGQNVADLDATLTLANGASLVDVADNPIDASGTTVDIPTGQRLTDNHNIEIVSDQVVRFLSATQSVSEGTTTLHVPIVLQSSPASPLSIPFHIQADSTATSGSDYTITATSFSVPAGATSADIVVTILDDAIAEPTDTIHLVLDAASGVTYLSPNEETISILDNEQPTLSIADKSVNEGLSGQSTMSFTVTRLGSLDSALAFSYSTNDVTATAGSDYLASSGAGYMAAGVSSASINVTINGDATVEADETFQVTIGGVTRIFGADPAFATAQAMTVGLNPLAVAAADFNLDGKPDLISADFDGLDLSLFVNNTNPGATTGAFLSRQPISLTTKANSIAVGDFNGDGRPDVVVGNQLAGTVTVFLNTTTPGATTISLTAAQTFGAGTSPSSIALADINGDGRLDMVVTNSGSNNVSILRNTTTLNSSTASFATAQNFTAHTQPVSLVVGDFNGDGRTDIATANQAVNDVSVYLNTTTPGATTFTLATRQDVSAGSNTNPRSLAVGDVNQDGLADLVTADFGINAASVLLNSTTPGSTTPSFAAAQTIAIGATPQVVILTDLNGDGSPDIVAANANSATLSVVPNQTSPGAAVVNFGAKQTIAVDSNPAALAVADFNLDGRADIATTSTVASNASVVLNTTPTVPQIITTTTQTLLTQTGPVATISVDLNGDGKKDLVSANDVAGSISVLGNLTTPGAASANLAASQDFSAGSRPVAIVAGDINGDGRPDLALVNYNASTISILLNTSTTGATTFSFATRQTISTSANPADLVLADFNGDGLLDLAVACRSNNTVSVLVNTTSAGATTATFNPASSFTTASGPSSLIAADLNGDGLADLAVAAYTSGVVSVLRNTTTPGATAGSFATKQDFSVATQPQSIAVGDLNQDGRLDLAIISRNSSVASVLLSTTTTGSTTFGFTAKTDFAVGSQPNAVAIGDLNRDGLPDLVVANAGGNSISQLVNSTVAGATTAAFTALTAQAVGSSPRDVIFADLNSDSLVDLVTSNRSSNNLSAVIRQGANLSTGQAVGTIVNDDAVPVVNLVSTSRNVNENVNTTTIVIQLSNSSAQTVTVPFSINVATSATSGSDYTVSANPLTIPIGATSAAITVTVIDDQLNEASETVVIDLGTPFHATLGAQTQFNLTITDNDAQPSVQFSAISQTVFESVGNMTVTAVLSKPSGLDITAPITITGNATEGSDFAIDTHSLVFPAGQTSAVLTITVADDTAVEPDEDIVLTLGTPSNATLGPATVHTVTLLDNDTLNPNPPQVNLSVSPSNLAENGGTTTVRATLNATTNQTVLVNLAFSGSATLGSDYTRSAAQITIAPGATSGSITLSSLDDALVEGNESIVVDIASVANGTENGTQQITATILDDDVPPTPSVNLSVSPASFAENGGTATVTATMSTSTSQTVTINLGFTGTAAFNSDYTRSAALITIAAGATSGSITLSSLDDLLVEGNESVIVDITSVTNGTENGTQQVTATIIDDDVVVAPVVSLSLSPNTMAEQGGTATIRATLDISSSQTVTVDLGFAGTAVLGSDYNRSSAQITIPSGATSGSIMLTAVDDYLKEGNESIVVDIIGATGATENGIQQVTATIIDDATDFLQLSGTTLSVLGTAGTDILTVQQLSSTSVQVTVNSRSQTFTSSQIATIQVDGLGGGDTFYGLFNIGTTENLTFTPGGLSTTASGISVSATNVTAVIVYGDAVDSQVFTGSSNDDVYYGYPNAAIISMGSQYAVSVGVTNTTLQGSAGQDAAVLVGSSGDDTFTAHPNQTTFVGPGFSHNFTGWTHVYAYGISGNDTAQLFDDTTNDEFHALSSYSVLLGPRPTGWATFLVEPIGFGTVRATASGGGLDLAVLYDTTGNETFNGNNSLCSLSNSSFRVEAAAFDYVYGLASSGGTDTAILDGSTGNDYLLANGPLAQLYSYSNGAYVQIYYFDTVTARSNGGTDAAHRDAYDYALTLQGTWVTV